MSYDHESDSPQTDHEPGPDPTVAYQDTAEWEAVSERAPWEEHGADQATWESDEDGGYEQHWSEPSAEQESDGDADQGGVGGAKQTISVAADKITRWFAGLDRRPEYEDQLQPGDPVAEVAPATAASARTRGASADWRPSRSIAVNRRRSVAAPRSGAPTGEAFARGSAHAARALRDGEPAPAAPPVPVAPEPAAVEPLDEPLPELMGGEGSARFAVAPLGYNRQAVDRHVSELEHELAELRAALTEHSHQEAPMSIQEELERIGEQTASILVVAHDKAHETTRDAQEQAERCVAEAAENAVRITDEANRKLREIEAETESVQRRRERLIADVRRIQGSLGALADDADTRVVPSSVASEPESDAAAPAPAETAVSAG